MGLFGPREASGRRTAAALKTRQSEARKQDANASAHPNKVTLAELRDRKR